MAVQTQVILNKIFEESARRKTGHVGSCISVAPILNQIYTQKNKNDIVVLSSGHAGLALYITLREHGYPIDVESKGVHPDYSPLEGIDASTGSLGHGIGIAVGYALADRSRMVYCVCSDGEISEGSFWEALNVAVNQKLSNLKVVLNCNGYSAYGEVDYNRIVSKILGWGCAALAIDSTDEAIASALSEGVPNTVLVTIVKTASDFGENKGLHAHYKPIAVEEISRL